MWPEFLIARVLEGESSVGKKLTIMSRIWLKSGTATGKQETLGFLTSAHYSPFAPL